MLSQAELNLSLSDLFLVTGDFFFSYGLWSSNVLSDFSVCVLWMLSHQEVHCQTNHSSAFPVVTFWYNSLNCLCADEFFQQHVQWNKVHNTQLTVHQLSFQRTVTKNITVFIYVTRCPRLLLFPTHIYRISILTSAVIHSFRHTDRWTSLTKWQSEQI